MAEKDVNLNISGNESDLVASLARAGAAVKRSTEEMAASFERFNAGIGKVQRAFLAFTAVVLGGEAIKRIAEESANWAIQSDVLAKQLGISTEQASVYLVALKHLGIEAPVLAEASAKMSRQLYAHSEAFEQLGVKTRNASGHFRPAADLIGEVNSKLLLIQNPIERNIAAMQVYGRSWEEIRPLLRLTAESMDEAGARAKELGLVVGDDFRARARAYEESMNDLKLVNTALSIQMGKVLLPTLTQISTAMAGEAPKAAEVLGYALKVIVKLVAGLYYDLKSIGLALAGLFAAAGAALTGNFSGAREVMHGLHDDLVQVDKDAAAFFQTLDRPVPVKGGGSNVLGDPNAGAPTTPKTSRLPEFELELAQRKATYETEQGFRQFSLQQERDYWQSVLATVTLSSQERTAIKRKVADAEAALAKQQFTAQMEELKVQEAAYRNNVDAKLEIARKAAAMMLAAYGADSREYKEAAKHIVEIEREKQAQLVQIGQIGADFARDRDLAAVDAAEAAARLEVSLGLATDTQLLQQEMQFEEKRFQIRAQALAARLALAKLDPDYNAELVAQLQGDQQQLERQHNQRMNDIKAQAAISARSVAVNAINSLTQQWEGGLSRMLQGQLKFSQAIKGAWKSIGAAVADSVAKSVMANVQGLAKQALLHKKAIMNDAYKAASGAFHAMVGIPYIGPVLAPVAAAAAFVAVSAFGSSVAVPSGAQGYDVPAGVNPMTQLHQREMVLPAHIADPLRSQLAGGGMGQPIHLHINAVDAPSVERLFRENGQHLATVLRDQVRQFRGVMR